MQEIVLSCADWTTPEDFYQCLLPLLGAPDWHGHNLDALWDSITCGGINRVNPPFKILVTEVDELTPLCKGLLDRFVALIAEAEAEGIPVEISFDFANDAIHEK